MYFTHQALSCQEILLLLCHNATLSTILALSQTCRDLTPVARESARKRIDERVKPFVDNPLWFRTLLANSRSLVTGEVGLDVVLANEDTRRLKSPILTVVVPGVHAASVRREFMKLGYRRITYEERDDINDDDAINIQSKSGFKR